MLVNGCALVCGTAAWEKAYLSDIREIITEATSTGAYVLWVGLPIMQPVAYSQGVALLNSLYKLGATTQPTRRSCRRGRCSRISRTLREHRRRERYRDDASRERWIHFSPSGWDVLATYVIARWRSSTT